jgi:curli production assembly/transport component CsgG
MDGSRAMIKKMLLTVCFAATLFGIISCAAVHTERLKESYETADTSKPFPLYNGPKSRVQIIRFGIPQDIISKYPELADKRVGWGLYNRLIDGFYDTNRFEFVEEKKEIQKRILDQWVLSQKGIIIEEEQIESEGLSAPQYLIYAEVYDFSVSYSEILIGIAMEKVNTTIIGIQIRMVDVATGKYIPASGTGEAKSTAASVWVNASLPFDQSTVGIASQKAVNTAIRNLLERINT